MNEESALTEDMSGHVLATHGLKPR